MPAATEAKETAPEVSTEVEKKDVPWPRPLGAPQPKDVLKEFETKHGWVFVLKKKIKVDVPKRTKGGVDHDHDGVNSAEEWTKKIFIAKPGHEAYMRPVDRAYLRK